MTSKLAAALLAWLLLLAGAAQAGPGATPSAGLIQQLADPHWIARQLERIDTHSGAHIGASDRTLRFNSLSQITKDGKQNPKSSFTDKPVAAMAVGSQIRTHAPAIEKWLARQRNNPAATLTLPGKPENGINLGKGKLGRIAYQNGQTSDAYGARVVLQRNPNAKIGFDVKNAYPTNLRSYGKLYERFRATPAGRMGGAFGTAASRTPKLQAQFRTAAQPRISTGFNTVARAPLSTGFNGVARRR